MLWVGCALLFRLGFALESSPFDDVESLLTPPSDVVSPQGLFIIRRSSVTSTNGQTLVLEESYDKSVIPGWISLFGFQGFASLLAVQGGSQNNEDSKFVLTRYDDDTPHEESAARDFECPCGRDVANLCEPRAPSYDDFSDFATVYEKRLCLARQRARVSPACAQHLADAPTVVEYCYNDIERSCADVKPGDNRVHACLVKADVLDSVCADYVRAVIQQGGDNDDEDDDTNVKSILQASFALLRSFLEDDDKLLDASLNPPSGRPTTQHVSADEDVNQNTTAESKARPNHASRLSRILRIVVYTLLLFITAISLYTLAAYAYRKISERRQRLQFKQKFAPLLVESGED